MEKEEAFAQYRIYKLAEDERIESFDCGDADLNDFALNDAQPYRGCIRRCRAVLLEKRFCTAQ